MTLFHKIWFHSFIFSLSSHPGVLTSVLLFETTVEHLWKYSNRISKFRRIAEIFTKVRGGKIASVLFEDKDLWILNWFLYNLTFYVFMFADYQGTQSVVNQSKIVNQLTSNNFILTAQVLTIRKLHFCTSSCVRLERSSLYMPKFNVFV